MSRAPKVSPIPAGKSARNHPPQADYSDEVTNETLAALEELVKEEVDASSPLEVKDGPAW